VDEFFALFVDSDFDFTGHASVLRVERVAKRLELLLELRAFSGDFERQAWIVSCAEERHSLFRSEPFYGADLLSDHVLLAPYRDARIQLGIKGAAANAKSAVADLWEAHHSVAGRWFPFDAFLNRALPLSELLASNAAVVADGPSRIIQAYARALASHVDEAYSIRETSPKQWLDMAWQPEDPDVQLLLLEPQDYIIGKGFAARRASSDLLPPEQPG